MLKVEKLTKYFGGIKAIEDVSLEIAENTITAIIGPNGAGKTTLFNIITGVYPPTSGRVLLDEEDQNRLKPHQVCEKGIARTFQNIRLFSNMTVLENVLVGFHKDLRANLFTSVFSIKAVKEEELRAEQEAYRLLQFVGLENLLNETAENLSYGLQRKLEIARALATKPKLLLLDEPAAGMNPKETKELTDLIIRIREHFQVTVVLIEHDMKLVMNISEQIFVLDHGEKIAEGDCVAIQNNKKVIEAYLGTGVVGG